MPNSPSHTEVLRSTRHRDASWRVRSDLQAVLLSETSPDWFALQDDARATCVKRGHDRAIWRVELDGMSVFVKVAKGCGLIDRLRACTGQSAAHYEWRVGLSAKQKKVAVVEPLAIGVRGLLTVLITRAWDGGVGLGEVWGERVATKSGSSRRRVGGGVIRVVAAHAAASHERGFVHRDSHPENILVRFDGDVCTDAVFVDVRSATIHQQPTSLDESLRSIAELDQSFHRRATRTERWRFLLHYMASRAGFLPSGERAKVIRMLLAKYARISMEQAQKLAKTRDRRLRRSGKYFATFSVQHGWSVTAALQLSRRHAFAEAGVPDRTPDQWRAELASILAAIGDQTTASGVMDAAGLSLEYRTLDSFVDRVRATLLGVEDRRLFEECHQRRHRDLSSDLVLGYGWRRSGFLVDATVVIRPAVTTLAREDARSLRAGSGSNP